MKNAKRITLTAGLVLIAGFAVLKRGPGASPALPSKDDQTSEQASAGSSRGPASLNAKKAMDSRAGPPALAGPPKPGAGAALASAPHPERKTRDGFKYQRELDDFTFLKKKIFLSDEEKSERKRLIQNETLLRSLEDLLKAPAGKDFESQAETSMALDLLFEALQTPSADVAAGVLKDLIQDNSVEDKTMDMQSRKELAGVKAEVLYQWTSLEPSRAGEIRNWLPGPVSQNIWKNVVSQQQSNTGESQAELAANRQTHHE